MSETVEIRWHARAGQGAKTAAQVLALALLKSGQSVQAFPEYGPERRGAPLRAFTRTSSKPIRRHDSITHPDLVVVLEPSLVRETDVADGLQAGGQVLVNAESAPPELDGLDVTCVPATRLAAAGGSGFVNVVMLGAVAAALGVPPVGYVEEAAAEQLAKKAPPDEVRAAVRRGYECLN
jgi:2-oxoacid:acceptor oxidoreductase gamma subunit (pyruvate/2-ketoisovalerate family)